MISKILTLKQHKTHDALTRMHQDEIALEHEKQALQQIQDTIAACFLSQKKESDRLFEELSKAPATMTELETYNATLSKMKQDLNTLHLEQTTIEAQLKTAQSQLLKSQDTFKEATQKQEKFSYLNQNSIDIAHQESAYHEDQLLDDIIDTMYASSNSTAHGVF